MIAEVKYVVVFIIASPMIFICGFKAIIIIKKSFKIICLYQIFYLSLHRNIEYTNA